MSEVLVSEPTSGLMSSLVVATVEVDDSGQNELFIEDEGGEEGRGVVS